MKLEHDFSKLNFILVRGYLGCSLSFCIVYSLNVLVTEYFEILICIHNNKIIKNEILQLRDSFRHFFILPIPAYKSYISSSNSRWS